MAFSVSGAIVPSAVLSAARDLRVHAKRALAFDLVLVTSAAPEEREADLTAEQEHPLFRTLTPARASWIRRLARAGPVAYVEAELFGGVGYQVAAGWDRDGLALGPFFSTNDPEERERLSPQAVDRTAIGAINAALRWLGVRALAGLDELDTVGIDWRRAPRG